MSSEEKLFGVLMCKFCLCAVNGGSPVTLDDVIKPASSVSDEEDQRVMETKLTIIEILKVLCFTWFINL